jgi:NAD(P)-dependent dehydrogenase (short-subunit alcohol dehydrogenase family)
MSSQSLSSVQQASFHNALITGASRGLGRALALELARQGVPMVLVARGLASLDAVVEEVQQLGGVAHPIIADLGRPEDAARIVGMATQLVGPLDLVVHNASLLGPTPLGPLLDHSDDDFRAVLEVNLLGPFRVSRLVAGGMALRGRGTLVHISSDAAVDAYPHWGLYGASKAALDHLARTWAAELSDRGVVSVAVDPGEMDTAMHAAAIPDADPTTLARPADVARALLQHLPHLSSGDRVRVADLRRAA